MSPATHLRRLRHPTSRDVARSPIPYLHPPPSIPSPPSLMPHPVSPFHFPPPSVPHTPYPIPHLPSAISWSLCPEKSQALEGYSGHPLVRSPPVLEAMTSDRISSVAFEDTEKIPTLCVRASPRLNLRPVRRYRCFTFRPFSRPATRAMRSPLPQEHQDNDRATAISLERGLTRSDGREHPSEGTGQQKWSDSRRTVRHLTLPEIGSRTASLSPGWKHPGGFPFDPHDSLRS